MAKIVPHFERCVLRATGISAATVWLSFAVTSSAAAQPVSQYWIAVSKTAMDVTGDIRFTPSSIAFAPGPRIAIRYLKDFSRKVSYAPTAPGAARAQLYRVLSPDPRLIGGNRLCGQRPTFLTVLRTSGAGGPLIFLTIYSGAAEPRGTPSDAICAGYTYAPQARRSGSSDNTRPCRATHSLSGAGTKSKHAA